MDLRKKMKGFFTLTRNANGGFTLVELIVVIAILAILAGVGIPVYSGYITKANKQADMTLVSEVKNALMLYAITNPDDVTAGSCIVLNPKGSGDAVPSDSFAEAAMDAVFSDGWENRLSLSYDGWTGGKIMLDTLTHFQTWEDDARTAVLAGLLDGAVNPVFENEVDTLYDLVESVATDVGDGVGISGVALLQGAADATIVDSKTAADIAQVWSTDIWDSNVLMDGQGNSYTSDGIDGAKEDADNGNANLLNLAIANAGAIKARNTCFAIYMRDSLGYDEYYDLIANLTLPNSSVIPMDIVAFINDDDLLTDFYEKNAMNESEQIEFETIIWTGVDKYFNSETETNSSQAYQDGLAYYALMDTVNNVNNDEATNEETYWDDMEAAVKMYGAVARGEVSVSSMNTVVAQDGSVVVTLVITNTGVDVVVSPVAVDSIK